MAESTTVSAAQPNIPQPGDGAYLASRIPQPGDGAYLAAQSQRNSGGPSRPRGQPGRSNGPRKRNGNGPRNGNGTVNGNNADVANGASDAAAQLATLSIEEVTPANRRSGSSARNGRRLPTAGLGDSFVPISESDGTDKKSNNRRAANNQRRRARAAQGAAENDEEARALGLGRVDLDVSPMPSGVSTPLNPGAAHFTPNGSAVPSPSASSGGEGNEATPPASESGYGKKGRNAREPQPRREQRAKKEAPPKPVSSRRAAFERGSKLTTADDKPAANAHHDRHDHDHQHNSNQPDDLNSRLTRGLRGKPFIECPICFAPIYAQQQTWSCLPPHSGPVFPAGMPENERVAFTSSHYTACYTPFHIQCIRDWSSRSLKDETERLRTIESADEPYWRCPGCQKRRTSKVSEYRCFCGRQSKPATNSTAPHSCNDACARMRPNCDHPCPLNCHPGPCPPCQVALVVRCPSHGTPLTVKCATASTNDAALTPVCDEPCPGKRACGKHDCDRLCHFGPCAPCEEVETVRCYCGDEEKAVPCGWQQHAKKQCATADEQWIGRFACERICSKPYECGVHHCKDKCHPHSVSPLACPTSPSVISTCPCGATPLKNLPGYPRVDCLAPIPTCGSPCPKTRPCGHPCPLKCHDGSCPPCHQHITRPCRCGESTLLLECDEVRERSERGESEFLCERVCKALRNCGRHECGRVCCPLSYKAKRKGRRGVVDLDFGTDDLHVCSLTCGKLLSCGLHTCPRPDHKGACGRCLQASYEELICNCGNTVVYPPVACGATVHCLFPCARPDPPCGHPKTAHNCHESPECPACPFLTTKPCACGKDPAVKNVRCSQSQDRVSCGTVCGKLLGCGYHRCEKTCHPGGCEPCAQTCNKPKRICKHACTAVCHAPAKCPEGEACATMVTQQCACGHLQSRTSCGASFTNPSSRETVQLKCNSECMVRQRNARLADALGIKSPIDRTLTEWSPDLKAFARQNHSFVLTVEQTFKDFILGARTTLILPHMPPAKRTFVIGMADVYHLGRELIDAEPNRSVQIRRRIDTRLPNPLLSAAAPAPVATRLGGLANLRANASSPSTPPVASSWSAGRPAAGSSTTAATVATPPTSLPTSRVPSPGIGAPSASAPAPTPVPTAPVAAPLAPVVPTPVRATVMPHTNIPVPVVNVYSLSVGDDDDWDHSGDEA